LSPFHASLPSTKTVVCPSAGTAIVLLVAAGVLTSMLNR
jgi:hypothetical protein